VSVLKSAYAAVGVTHELIVAKSIMPVYKVLLRTTKLLDRELKLEIREELQSLISPLDGISKVTLALGVHTYVSECSHSQLYSAL
jgi:hypothetical protein